MNAARGVILLYHRIAESDADPFDLCVSPERFAEQLRALRTIGRLIPLSELPDCVDASRGGDRFVVVTFDDGYADNLYAARPILEQFGIPATIFVAAGSVGNERGFWWDELAAAVMTPSAQDRLTLQVGGATHRFELGGPAQRQLVYVELWTLLRSLSEPERVAALDEMLASWSPSAGIGDGRPLSRVELVRLASDPLIELGAHTVTHPVLSSLPIDDQRREILESKRLLEEIVDQPVQSFSYPYGRNADFGPETIELVRGAGFCCACTNEPAAVREPATPFELPRVMVWDWSGDELVEHVERMYLT